jgi:hypothetical protein
MKVTPQHLRNVWFIDESMDTPEFVGFERGYANATALMSQTRYDRGLQEDDSGFFFSTAMSIYF